jgi:hypothetical protein
MEKQIRTNELYEDSRNAFSQSSHKIMMDHKCKDGKAGKKNWE